MNNVIYEMSELNKTENLINGALLIFAVDKEERSQFALKKMLALESKGNKAIIFAYEKDATVEEAIDDVGNIVNEDVAIIDGFPTSQYEFVCNLKERKEIHFAEKIVIDVSSILTPYLFLLIKYIKVCNPEAKVFAINTIPFDYTFPASPFVSYRSYFGNLIMEEVFGFSSSQGLLKDKELFIFAGFEGALAMKVVEDTEYNQLYYVNALPSYHQKYKDINFINNYHLLVSKNCKRLYAPAINPFEVYNLLDKYVKDDTEVSIAPLCTKPMSLGICMYALGHQNVRIIYPFSDKYKTELSHDVYKSYVYKLVL